MKNWIMEEERCADCGQEFVFTKKMDGVASDGCRYAECPSCSHYTMATLTPEHVKTLRRRVEDRLRKDENFLFQVLNSLEQNGYSIKLD